MHAPSFLVRKSLIFNNALIHNQRDSNQREGIILAKGTKDMIDLFDDSEFEKEPNNDIANSVPPKWELESNIWPIVEKNVPKRKAKLLRFIGDYRNRYINILETPYPTQWPLWKRDCIDIIYETAGITEDELFKYTQNIEGPNGYIDPYLKKKDKGEAGHNKCFQFAMLMIYRYFLLNNMPKEATIMKYFMGYYAYTMGFSSIFHPWAPNPQVMEFTINRMSYRNKLKQLGSVQKWIYYGIDGICTTYNERIIRGADYDYLYTFDKLRERFKAYFKVLFNEYNNDFKNKDAIVQSKTFTDSGDQFPESSGIGDIISLAEKHTSMFFQHPVSEKAIKDAIDTSNKAGHISEKDLRNTIFMLADNPENQDDVREFYQALFYIFLNLPAKYSPKDVHSTIFIVEMQKAYKPGNSLDENRTIVRDKIDKWLKIGSSTYRSSNRPGTLSVFRRAIFDYFIFKAATD